MAQLFSLGSKTMPTIAKLSRGFAVLFWVVAAFWFILPWWQVQAGMYDGPVAFIVCTLFAFIFAAVGFGLYFCYRRTRSGEISRLARILIWTFVCLAGLAGSAMALRIIWCTIPWR